MGRLVTSAASGRANHYRLSNPDLDKLALLIGGHPPRRVILGPSGCQRG